MPMCFDYLLKPLTDEAISACLQGVMKDRQEKPAFSRRLVVKSGERTLLLHQEGIIYLRVNGNYLTAVVTEGEPCKWYGRLQQIAPLLDECRSTETVWLAFVMCRKLTLGKALACSSMA